MTQFTEKRALRIIEEFLGASVDWCAEPVPLQGKCFEFFLGIDLEQRTLTVLGRGHRPAIYPPQLAEEHRFGDFHSLGLFGRRLRKEVSMYDLTGFQRDMLYIIAGLDEPHGLAIKDELEDYYEQEVHHGRLYPNLDTIVDKGLADKGEKDRRTNEYTITARGKREIEARQDWEAQYTDQ